MSRFALLVLAGCDVLPPGGAPNGGDDDDTVPTDVGDDDDTDTPPEMFDLSTSAGASGSDGRFEVEVAVLSDVTAFQVTAVSDQYVGLEAVYDPSGTLVLYWEDWYYSVQSLTNAIFAYDKATAFDWPIRAVDGSLEAGTWRTVWSVIDENYFYVPFEPVTVSVARKRDTDLASSEIGVQIVWANGVDDEAEVVDAVEQAVERWREVWGLYGLTLREYYEPSTLDPELPFAGGGGDEILPVAGKKEPGDLMLVVGDTIGGSYGLYGIAGGIPGTVEVTPNTYVVVSWLVHAGPNGLFDDDEIRLMGETMAHETGHYEGLFHPVESNYIYWDALTDTPECTAAGPCESALGTNLMFPYALCTANSCLATDELTVQQQGVVQRYVGAL